MTQDKPLLNLDEEPHNADWLRILAQRKEPDAMADSNSLSTAPWDGSASRYPTAAAYAEASLVNLNTGPSSGWTKDKIHLPVKEPGGAYNRAALGAAAAALAGGRGGGVQIPPAAKKAAARKLAALYRRFQLPVPDSLARMAL